MKTTLTPLQKLVSIAISSMAEMPKNKAIDFAMANFNPNGISVDELVQEINQLTLEETASRQKERSKSLEIKDDEERVPDACDILGKSFFDENGEIEVDGEIIKKEGVPLKEDDEKSILEIDVEDEEKPDDVEDEEIDDLEEKTSQAEIAEEERRQDAIKAKKQIEAVFAKI